MRTVSFDRPARGERLTFDGWIAGLGTTSGTRIVLGHWPRSPFGPVSDLMIESANGHRLLLASTTALADFVAATYTFDEIALAEVDVRPGADVWTVLAGPLRLRFTLGTRGTLGTLLRAVPPTLARRPPWIAAFDLPARLTMPGVRTRGSAGGGRREWYGAQDLRPLASASASLDGRDLGRLAPVSPPVRFGFGSVPTKPALVRVTTTVELPARRPGIVRPN